MSVSAAFLQTPAYAKDKDSNRTTDQSSGFGSGYVFVGAGYLPDYEGSSDYKFLPYFSGRINSGNYYLAFQGGQLRANIVNSPHFHAGPVIGYRRPRTGAKDSAVSRMRHVGHAFSAGGFVEYERVGADPRYGEQVRLSVTQAFSGVHSGVKATARAMAYRPLKFVDPGLIATVEIDASWASSAYMHRYFDVDASDAAASGLPVFHAGSGFKSVGVALALDQYLSRKWSIGLRTHYGRLLGAAADSPVTAIAGSPNQAFVGLVVGYVL